MKLEIGTKVTGKNGNGIISKIITKSTGYVLVNWNNGKQTKEMAFNLNDENGVSLKNKPAGSGLTKAQKNARDIAAYNALSPMEKATRELMSINGLSYGNRSNSTYEFVASIEMAARGNNELVESISKSVFNSMRISEKQAYVLAKFAVENNINF